MRTRGNFTLRCRLPFVISLRTVSNPSKIFRKVYKMKTFIIFSTFICVSSAVLDYPLKCAFWTWGEWDRNDCLPLGHPNCAKEKRKEVRYRQVQWRPKYGEKLCSGKYVDYRPCICLSPEAAAFVSPPQRESILRMIEEFVIKRLLKPITEWFL